jgi:peptidoglycan/LPS O-acetylase OafA/YrhL
LNSLNYRPDFDGLRAIAVLAVLAFHGFPNLIKGGFLGVDVFFVLSGYLISLNIFQRINKGTFNFLEFYYQRIRRIFPALILVLTACAVIGWFLLLAEEYKQFSKYLTSATLFISNLSLLRDVGYFDTSAETKPLLNLWSLGVEAQFYILWPLFIWFALKLKVRLFLIILVFTLSSFFINFIEINNNFAVNFYSPHTRFWELSVGSGLALISLNNQKIYDDILRNIFSVVGILLLGVGFWVVNKDNVYFGFGAIFAVIGSAFLIFSGPSSYINQMLLSSRVLVWVGSISYPLYLWHWPIIVFFRIIKGDSLDSSEVLTLLLISIGLAFLTNRYWEHPLRFSKRKKIITILCGAMMTIGAFGILSIYEGGFSNRKVVTRNLLLENDRSDRWPADLKECSVDGGKYVTCIETSNLKTKFLVIGDSKAKALFPGLVKTTDKNGWIYLGSSSGESPLLPVLSDNFIYEKFRLASQPAIKWVSEAQDVKVVLFVMATRHLFNLQSPNGAERDIGGLIDSPNYEIAKQGLFNSVDAIVQKDKIVVFVLDNPTLPYPEDCIGRKTAFYYLDQFLPNQSAKCTITFQQHLSLTKQYRDLLNEIKSSYPGQVYIFDSLKYLCEEREGICTHFKNNNILYSYTDHISNYAARLLGKEINDYLENLLLYKNKVP